MASAEVRAAWQRTANRCFVQEDAKRAPKLACCQSSCETSKLVDAGPISGADESDHAAVNATHFNQKSSFSNPTPDSRWWLNLHPNYECRKGLAHEQLSVLEEKVENLKVGDENRTCKDSMEGMQNEIDSQGFPELMDMMAKHEKMEIDSVCCSVSEQTKDFSLDSDCSWIECEKAQPWWQTTDKDELACLVSQKSLNHIENCDLPPPRMTFLGGQPCAGIGDNKIKTASFDQAAKSSVSSNLNVQAKRRLDSTLKHRNLGPSSNKEHLYVASDISSSYTTIHEGVMEQVFEGDHSKAQLMEALCHSQTRAREAEEMAKQAHAEKDHIFAIFFIQASQLFAYEQWFQLLQLETHSTQIKNNDQPISTLFPETLPWMAFEGRKRKQKLVNAKQEMLGKPKSDISTYAVAFALGLSLVGAGLFLGWTVGWMLPRL